MTDLFIDSSFSTVDFTIFVGRESLCNPTVTEDIFSGPHCWRQSSPAGVRSGVRGRG